MLCSNPTLHSRRGDELNAPALQHEDNSNRPFQTVCELAKSLGVCVVQSLVLESALDLVTEMLLLAGMDPQMEKRTVTSAGVFNNQFAQKERAVSAFVRCLPCLSCWSCASESLHNYCVVLTKM